MVKKKGLRRWFAVILALAMGFVLSFAATPAHAASTYLCNSQQSADFATCTNVIADATHGYNSNGNNTTSYWRAGVAASGHNCTNYIGYMLTVRNGVPSPGIKMGDGKDWDESALSLGYAVDQTPKVGSIAQWNAVNSSDYGHVAYVESVAPDNSSITVSEDNYITETYGYFDWRTIYPGSSWPDNFLHIGDGNISAGMPSAQTLVVQVGADLWSKTSPNGSWSQLTNGYTRDLQVAGSRVAFVNGAGELWAQENRSAAWTMQIPQFDNYILTPDLLLVRVGSTLYGKAKLTDGWSILTTGIPPNFTASGNRIAYLTGNTLMTKDGVNGEWKNQTSGFDSYTITSSLIVVQIGTRLDAKKNPDDTWSRGIVNDYSRDLQVAGSRIAYVNSAGMLRAGDGLSSSDFTDQIAGFDDYYLSDSMLIVRVGANLYGKAALTDAWSLLTPGAPPNTRLDGQWVTFTDSAGLTAKLGVNGKWFSLLPQFDTYVIG